MIFDHRLVRIIKVKTINHCALSSVGKTMEKLVHKHVHNYLLENSIITSFQSGFTARDSSVNQLVELYNTFCQALGSFRFL